MRLSSKEDFIDLYLAVRSEAGYLVFTQNIPDDFFPWLSNRKYNDLFSFFHTKEDFDFMSSLDSYFDSGMGSIELIHREDSDTIRFFPEFCYSKVPKILSRFDEMTFSQMEQLIYDMEKTKSLNSKLKHEKAKGVYQMANPNGFYKLNEEDIIFSDGVISEFDNRTYLVEDALFSVVETFLDGQLNEMKVFSFYENDDYVNRAIEQILLFNHNNSSKTNTSLKEVQTGKVYQYGMRY